MEKTWRKRNNSREKSNISKSTSYVTEKGSELRTQDTKEMKKWEVSEKINDIISKTEDWARNLAFESNKLLLWIHKKICGVKCDIADLITFLWSKHRRSYKRRTGKKLYFSLNIDYPKFLVLNLTHFPFLGYVLIKMEVFGFLLFN